jgi:hypothetical protein
VLRKTLGNLSDAVTQQNQLQRAFAAQSAQKGKDSTERLTAIQRAIEANSTRQYDLAKLVSAESAKLMGDQRSLMQIILDAQHKQAQIQMDIQQQLMHAQNIRGATTVAPTSVDAAAPPAAPDVMMQAAAQVFQAAPSEQSAFTAQQSAAPSTDATPRLPPPVKPTPMKAARRPAAGDPLPVYTPEPELKRAESSKASLSPSAKRSKVDPALLGQPLDTVKRPAAPLVTGVVIGHTVGSFPSSSDPLAVQNLEFGKLNQQLPDDSGFENLGDTKPSRPVVQGTVVADMSSFPAVQVNCRRSSSRKSRP